MGSLCDREVACSTSNCQGFNFEFCIWRSASSDSSQHPQEVIMAQLIWPKGHASIHILFTTRSQPCIFLYVKTKLNPRRVLLIIIAMLYLCKNNVYRMDYDVTNDFMPQTCCNNMHVLIQPMYFYICFKLIYYAKGITISVIAVFKFHFHFNICIILN